MGRPLEAHLVSYPDAPIPFQDGSSLLAEMGIAMQFTKESDHEWNDRLFERYVDARDRRGAPRTSPVYQVFSRNVGGERVIVIEDYTHDCAIYATGKGNEHKGYTITHLLVGDLQRDWKRDGFWDGAVSNDLIFAYGQWGPNNTKRPFHWTEGLRRDYAGDTYSDIPGTLQHAHQALVKLADYAVHGESEHFYSGLTPQLIEGTSGRRTGAQAA